MAELHGRVLGLPDREALATGLASAPRRELRAGLGLTLVVALLASAVAQAQAPAIEHAPLASAPSTADAVEAGPAISVAELERLAGELRSDDAAVRQHAVDRLGHLPASALPAIVERIRYLARLVIPPEDGEEALQRFRHATGSRRADDMIDVAPGIHAVLAEDRSAVVGRTAERVLLIRSLEQIGTLDAWRALADVYALSPEMWRWELRRALVRVGPRLMPALILARGHRDAALRRWARDGAEALRLTNPADAMQTEDLGQLAQLVLAYAEVRDLDAMPVTVGFVDHPDPPLREAARLAMERYGQNAIWQLRIAFRHKLNEEADLAWGWRRTMTELWTRLDEVRLAPQSARIDAATEALAAGRADEALAELDLVLRETPTPPRADEVASLLAGIATSKEDAEALRLLRRAAWLAPEHAQAAVWRARVALLEAEADRARGVLDLDAYEAAALVPLSETERARVAAVLEEGDAEALTEAARDESPGFPWSALAFLAALALATLVVLPRVVAWCTAQVSRFRRRRQAARAVVLDAAPVIAADVEVDVDVDHEARDASTHAQTTAPSEPTADEAPAASSPRGARATRALETHAAALASGSLRALRSITDRLRPHARRALAALRARLSPPVYGPRPTPPRAPRPRAELDPSLVLGAFAGAALDQASTHDDELAPSITGDLAADSAADLAVDQGDDHGNDEEPDDDESFDFDAVVAQLGEPEVPVDPSSLDLHEPSFDRPVPPAPEDSTLADVAFRPAHETQDDDSSNDDPDALLAALLLGADPSDTLPGAPAPRD